MKKVLLSLVLLAGCAAGPTVRPEPVEFNGKVSLAGAPPGGLTVTFQPMQNTLPGGAKVGADGRFKVSLAPGTYIVYFKAEANARVPAYRAVPAKFKTPSAENKITAGAGELAIDVR